MMNVHCNLFWRSVIFVSIFSVLDNIEAFGAPSVKYIDVYAAGGLSFRKECKSIICVICSVIAKSVTI